jgi:hypothetical protein
VQVLSDLNKHMRTVHHTYRRKAKIPKEVISELDSTTELDDLEPQIYGAKAFKRPGAASPPQHQETVKEGPGTVIKEEESEATTKLEPLPPQQSVSQPQTNAVGTLAVATVVKSPTAVSPQKGGVVPPPPLVVAARPIMPAAAAVPTGSVISPVKAGGGGANLMSDGGTVGAAAAVVVAVPAKSKKARDATAAVSATAAVTAGKRYQSDVDLELIKQKLGK